MSLDRTLDLPALARIGRALPAQTAAPDLELAASPVAGKHVLVVGINYAPEPTGIAPYTTGLAEHLAQTAASVEVFTGLPHYPSWDVPRPYRRRLRTDEVVGGVHVRRLALRPRVAVGRQARLLRGDVPRAREDRQAQEPAGRRHRGDALAGRPSRRGHHRPPLRRAAGDDRAGPHGEGRVAERHQRRWLGRRHDRAPRARGAARERPRAHRQRDLPRDAARLRRERRADRPAAELGAHHRCARRAQRRPRAARLGGGAVHRRAHGQHGPEAGPRERVEAARHLSDRRDVAFVFVGDGSQRRALEEQAQGLDNVRFVEPLGADEYPLALAAADALLVNERATVGDMSLPSKLTSYLTAGRPVLAATWPRGATGNELSRTSGAAQLVDPGYPQALADAVLALQADPAACASMGLAARSYAAARLGRGRSMAALDQTLAELLAAAGPLGGSTASPARAFAGALDGTDLS